MTLRNRLDRLEGATVKPASAPCVVTREIVRPGAAGLEVVALMRPRPGGDAVHVERNPGETEAEMRARFVALCRAARQERVVAGGRP